MGCHKQWRAQAKKMRRKRIRQRLAQERDEFLQKTQEAKEASPRYQAWLSEQKALALFAEEEEARLSAENNAAWLAEEARAQKAWKERQERLAMARAERAKQEIRIREEWEEEQRKLKATKEEQQRLSEEKQRKQEELMREIENFINKGGEMPPEVNVASMTNPDRPPCPFFTKTGACRFGDRCSRNHSRPAISRVLLVPNFYDHIGLRQMNPDELEAADDWLEYEDSETYHHFLDFYEDVLPEWKRIGRVSQFKVCCNFEPHLRGNVYIEYESAQDAVKAFKMFHGRYYGGKQINVEFVNIESWKAAICGQFHKHCCPKGRSCNFLHVFRNPGNAFYSADRDKQEWRRRQQRAPSPSPRRDRDRSWSGSPERSRRRDWRWSLSPSPPREHSTRSVRSHHSDRDNTPSRRRSHRRGVKHSSDKFSDHSSGKSHTKVRRQEESSVKNFDGSYSTNTNLFHAEKSSKPNRNYLTPTNKKGEELPTSPDPNTRNEAGFKKYGCENGPNGGENCPGSLEGNEVVEVNKHIYFDDNSHSKEDHIQKEEVKERRRKKKEKKPKKRKDSHRKEKRRKKKSRSRTDSSNSCSSDSEK